MLITHDCFDIASRLKEIDTDYTLHYNERAKKFELRGKNNTLLIVFPYDRIDARMITHARRTRVERIKEIIREMDEQNERLIASSERAQNNYYQDLLKETAEKHYVKRRKGID